MSHDTITFEKTDTMYSVRTRERLAVLCGPVERVRNDRGYLVERDGPTLAWMVMMDTAPGWMHKASGLTDTNPASLAYRLIKTGIVTPPPDPACADADRGERG